jgi:hypothetical protein
MGRLVVRPVLLPCRVTEIDEALEPDGHQHPAEARYPTVNLIRAPHASISRTRAFPGRFPRLCRFHRSSHRTLGRLQDALAQAREAGPPIALALEQLQVMDLSFGHTVAPFERGPALMAGRSSCSPRAKRASTTMSWRRTARVAQWRSVG